MHTGRSAGSFAHALLAVLVLSASPTLGSAQGHDNHRGGCHLKSAPAHRRRERARKRGARRDRSLQERDLGGRPRRGLRARRSGASAAATSAQWDSTT